MGRALFARQVRRLDSAAQASEPSVGHPLALGHRNMGVELVGSIVPLLLRNAFGTAISGRENLLAQHVLQIGPGKAAFFLGDLFGRAFGDDLAAVDAA